jgi:hypothetical protein
MFTRLIDRLTRGNRAGADQVPDDDVMLDLLDDDDLAGLLDDLAGLGDFAVPAAARERSWALVREEVRAREGRGAFAAGARSKAAYWRYALGSAAVIVAAVVGIVTFTAHEAPQVVSNSTSTNATQGPTSTAPSTTNTEPGTSTSTSGSPTTTGGSTPGTGTSTTGTAPAPGTGTSTTGTVPAPGTTGTTIDPQLRPPTSPRTTEHTTPTTAPPHSTTTGEPVMTQEQRYNSALAVATVLGQQVAEGNPGGASQVLTSAARPGLTMMVKSMTAPTFKRVASVSVGDPVTQVILAFTDHVPDGQGSTTTVELRFALHVQTFGGDTFITGIFQAAE